MRKKQSNTKKENHDNKVKEYKCLGHLVVLIFYCFLNQLCKLILTLYLYAHISPNSIIQLIRR